MVRIKRVTCLFFCCIIFCFFSCETRKEWYADKIVSLLQEDGVDIERFTHVVVIPSSGCGGCISEAEHFFHENKEEDMLFIFTKVYSEKELRLRLGDYLDKKNVLIDKTQLYVSNKEEMNIYPIIMDVRDKENLEWRFLEPGVSYREILKTFGK